jgi:hypothetical protein
MSIEDIDLEAVYKAIKYRLKAADPTTADHQGLNAYDHVPGASEWPGAFVLPPTVDPQGLGDDWCEIVFEIVVLVSAAFAVDQLKLLPYQNLTGPKSIPAAFRNEPTLGGLVGDIRITGSRPLGYEEQAGYQGFGCIFEAKALIG